MRERLKRNPIITMSLSASFVLTLIFMAGRLTGASTSDIQALQQRQAKLEERQAKIEALVTDRLAQILQAQNDTRTELRELRAEQRILHGGRAQ